jgi:peptide/nickel transport system substrate-binding protein
MSDTPKELQEYRQQHVAWRHALARERLSRRVVLRGSTILAVAGSGGAAAFLAACSSSSNKNGAKVSATAYNPILTTPAAGSVGTAGPGAVTGTPAALSTFKDTTGTPPYTAGLSDAQAQIDPKWQQFPFVYKYNWRRYPWNAPLTTGGHGISGSGFPQNFDLMKTQNGVQGSLYHQGLYHVAVHQNINLDTSSIEPDLAQKADHSADYSSWTFTIPQGVKFHNIAPVNGREITADDVVFSFQRYMDTSIWNQGLKYVDKVSATDKYTVKFDMKQPQVTFDAIVASPYYTIFAPENFQNQDGFKAQPIGTGPYMMKENVYQDHLFAVRNPTYHIKPTWMDAKYQQTAMPFMDDIRFPYYANTSAYQAAFIAKQVDDWPFAYLDPAQFKDLLKAVPDVLVTVNTLWATYPAMIYWNYKNPLFQDVRIRRALSMAVDREALMQQVFSGAGVPGGGPFAFDLLGEQLPPALKDYGQWYQYNPQMAQQLMAQAGHADGFQIHFEYPNGADQSIGFGVYKALQQAWKQNLKIDMVFDSLDPLTWYNNQLNHGFPDTSFQNTTVGYDAYSLVTPILHSGGGVNFGGVADTQLDALLDKLGAATSPATVQDLTKQIDAYVRDTIPYLYLGWPQAASVSQPYFHGQSNNLYVYLFFYGMSNFRSVWIDQTAPGGRGGKPV